MLLINLLSFLSIVTLPHSGFVILGLWLCNPSPLPTYFLVGSIDRSHRREGSRRKRPISITSAVTALHTIISSWFQPPTRFMLQEPDSSWPLRKYQHQPGCAHFSESNPSLSKIPSLSFWVLITQSFPFVPLVLKVTVTSDQKVPLFGLEIPLQHLCKNTLLLNSLGNIVCSVFLIRPWLMLNFSVTVS